jgi:ADP-ribose pyrophosphatase
VEDRARFSVLGLRRLVASGYLTVDRRHIVAPDGQAVVRDVVVHPGAVAVVPVIGDDVLLFRQYRTATGGWLLEIPAGKLDVAGEVPEAAAVRECEEEVGHHPGKLTHLADFYTAPGFCDEYMWVYLAEDLHRVPARPAGHEEHHAEVVRMPLAEAVRMASTGRIHDAKTILGLHLAAARR